MRRTATIALVGTLLAAAGGALTWLALVGSSGGEPDGYDPTVRFLLRDDPIVAKLPPEPPAVLHANGRLDEAIADLANRGGTLLDPATLPKAERIRLEAALEEVFGTPASPKLPGNPFGLSPETLALGSGVHKAKCAQCHGTAGDGRGPTGAWVYPHPRDFRLAKFKYVSTTNGLPTRADLAAMVKVGVAGNSMPGFALLPPEQLDAVIGYTLFLTMRGRVETDLLSAVLGEDGLDGPPVPFVETTLARWYRLFAEAEAKAVRPTVPALEAKDGGADPDHDAKVRRGFESFSKAACASCHRDYGREQHWLYDEWGVAVRPSNLSAGVFRAGGEPLDLFRRIRCGIPPSGMPAVDVKTLDDGQVWDLVLFLKSLSVPRQLPEDLRVRIYR